MALFYVLLLKGTLQVLRYQGIGLMNSWPGGRLFMAAGVG